MAKLDTQNRSERVDVQPDQRLRVTQVYDVLDYIVRNGEASFLAEIKLPWGTPHPTYPNCRLVKQDVTGQIENPFKNPNDPPPQLIRVWDEIPQNDQVMVGNPGISYDQYGRKSVVIEYIQFAAGTSLYNYVVGTTAAPAPNADSILKTYESTNDGTLIRKRLTFIDSGELSDNEELKFGGNVTIRTLTYLNEIPPTPVGFTLVTTSTEFIEGLPVYRYGFVKASGSGGGGSEGVISTSTEYRQSINQGTAGVTITTIRKVTPASVVVNPIGTPSGMTLIDVGYADEDGYRLWTAVYAKGAGEVDLETNITEGGKLYLYHKIGLGSAPSTPSATIGGTVQLVATDVRNADGYVIYDYKWAEGNGQVSESVDYNLSPDQGTTGVTVTTIVHLTALSVTGNPITPPASSELIQLDETVETGYKRWRGIYASGTGLVKDDIDIRNKGMLYIYSRTSINVAPTAPSASIGGTVVLISQNQRNGTDATSGTIVYDYQWAEGNGIISETVEGREDGSLVYNVVELDAVATTPAYPGSGTAYLVKLDQDADSGYYVNKATYIKPPATTTYKKQINFSRPGLALFTSDVLQLLPPTNQDLLADVEVSFGTTQDTTTPWTVLSYASLYELYTPTDTGIQIANIRGLGGYLAAPDFISGTNSAYNGVVCTTWEATLISSDPTSRPTGSTVLAVDNDPYLTATDGTKVYRRSVTSYTFP